MPVKTKNIFQKSALIFFSLVLLVSPLLVLAQGAGLVPESATNVVPGVPIKVVSDIPRTTAATKQTLKDSLTKAAKIAFKTALGNFLNQIAYDTATWIASGGEGQEPLFVTKGWTSYLTDAADNLAGTFLDKLSVAWNSGGGEFTAGKFTIKQNGTTLFSLDICAPSLKTQINIMVGLGLTKPTTYSSRCKISKMISNWDDAIKDEQYLPKLATVLKSENDLSLYLDLKEVMFKTQDKIEQLAILEKIQNLGFKDIKTKDDKIKTPGAAVAEFFFKGMITDATVREKSWVGEPVADAIAVFTNTLIGQVLQNLINGLYWNNDDSDSSSTVYNYESGSASSGQAAAKTRFASLRDVSPIVGGPYDILNKLTACPDSSNPGPTDCVIDEKFRFGIEKGLTVKQAMAEGWLDGKKAFGFEATQGTAGKEPDYKNGYPYRSFLILRKYRILPVGWEVAAQYIRDFAGQNFSLEQVVGVNDPASKYYGNADLLPLKGLVDPNWVLKAPEAYCRKEGPGPKVSSSSVNSGTDANADGDYDDNGDTPSSLSLSREDYCADEQSCIVENEDGSCKFYGYCTEERRTYDFGKNSSCSPVYNSCQTFQNSNGQTVSYLKNSVSWSCAVGDGYGTNGVAGCRPYSVWQANGLWQANISVSGGQSYNAIYYLDNDAQACTSAQAGCSKFIRLKPSLGTNLIANNSFEEGVNSVVWAQTEGSTVNINNPKAWEIFNGSVFADVINTADIPQGDTGIFGSKVLALVNRSVPTGDASCQQLTSQLVKPYLKPNHYYRLSFWGKAEDATSHWYANLSFGDSASPLYNNEVGQNKTHQTFKEYNNEATLNITTDWQKFTTETIKINSWADPGTINFNFSNCNGSATAKIYLDQIFLEEVNSNETAVSAVTDYGTKNLLYLTKPPAYYYCDDYNTDGSLKKSNDNAQCVNYATACTEQDIGCQLYKPVNGDPDVSAITHSTDQCPASCVGYANYVEQGTTFSAPSNQYLINNGKTCTAEAAGCEEFTNVDEQARGGEGKEYYSKLKLCQQPNAATEGTYYTWEGSDTTGYQLKTYQLRKSDTAVADKASGITSYPPCTHLTYSSPSVTACNEIATYSTDSCDPATDSDCREFFDTRGANYKRKLSLTVTSSENCHPYRRTTNNYNQNPQNGNTAEQDCSGVNAAGTWVGVAGWWNGSECLYYAVPNEGNQCAANLAGCRQYLGNSGNNTKQIFLDTFENNPVWSGATGSFNVSSEASYAGGHSLKIIASNVTSGNFVLQSGQEYEISFIAKAYNANVKPTLQLSGIDYQIYPISGTGSTLSTTQWGVYKNNFTLPATVTGDLTTALKITSAGWYLDNILIKLIRSNTYLIKNSWNVPVACDNILDDQVGAACGGTEGTPSRCVTGYMAGCQQYQDVDKVNWYFRQFSELCPADAAGCEALIDTANTNSPEAQTLNLSNGNDSAYIYHAPADTISYWVNDSKKYCTAEAVGCQAVGQKDYQTDWTAPVVNTYSTTYKILDLNSPTQVFCSDPYFRCDKFTANDNTYFFRNPLNTATTTGPVNGRACEYITKAGLTTPAWYVRSKNSAGSEVLIPCPNYSASPLYTVGYSESPVTQPVDLTTIASPGGYAGLCPASQNSCTELIEPAGINGSNLVFNADFSQKYTAAGQDYISGWKTAAGAEISYSDSAGKLALNSGNTYVITGSGLKVKANTLYTLSAKVKLVLAGEGGRFETFVTSSVANQLSSPDGSLVAVPAYNSYNLVVGNDQVNPSDFVSFSGRVYTGQATALTLGIKATQSSFAIAEIRLVENNPYYTLADNLDAKSCNGVVNPGLGCVLFNNRDSYAISHSSDYLKNGYDSDVSPVNPDNNGNGTAGTNCQVDIWNRCDSNTILKVTPDRVCNTWLYCKTSIASNDGTSNIGTANRNKDVCLDLGLCKAVDEKGNCSQVLNQEVAELNYNPTQPGLVANLSGYTKVGYQSKFTGDFPFAQMTQVGESTEVPNGDFTDLQDDGQPRGWLPLSSDTCSNKASQICYDSWVCDDHIAPKEYKQNWCNASTLGSWNTKYFKAITNPSDLITEGITSPNNKPVLKVNYGDYEKGEAVIVESELIDVFPDSEYVVSGYINTLNLNPATAQAVVQVWELKNNGTKVYLNQDATTNPRISPSSEQVWLLDQTFNDGATNTFGMNSRGAYSVYYLMARKDWTPFTVRIKTSANTTQLRLELSNFNPAVSTGVVAEGSGSSYFANLRLKPALKINGKSILATDCRLYPEDSALSCDYTNTATNVTYRGQKGYCLQYDSKNTKICLQWWPIDLPKGELTGSYGGYSGRSPLYYCAAGTLLQKRFEGIIATASWNEGGDNPNNCSGVASKYGTTAWYQAYDNSDATKYYYLSVDGYEPYFGYASDVQKISTDSDVCLAFVYNNQDEVYTDNNGQKYYGYSVISKDATSGSLPFRSGQHVLCDGDANHVYNVDLTSATCAAGTEVVLTGKILFYRSQLLTVAGSGECVRALKCTEASGYNCCQTNSKTISDPPVTAASFCTDIIQTVTPNGQNKAWLGRVSSGSGYKTAVQNFSQNDDYAPFASILAPSPDYNPTDWSLLPVDIAGDPSSTYSGKAHAGEFYSCDNEYGGCGNVGFDRAGNWSINGYNVDPSNFVEGSYATIDSATISLKRLFAQAYAEWSWNWTDKKYEISNKKLWSVPDEGNLCADTHQRNLTRPPYDATDPDADYCALAPRVTKIKVNGVQTSDVVSLGVGTQTAGLEFNITIDANQWPLTAYKVNWGDGTETAVSGVSLRDSSSSSTPVVLYHTYDYYSMKKNVSLGTGVCSGTTCSAPIAIQVKDNWGWCNGNLNLGSAVLAPFGTSAWGYYQNACSTDTNAWQKGPTVKVSQ
ncbi:MAG: hypothetical protein WCW02_03815 [Candidatus Buchananbacteria bacterium]